MWWNTSRDRATELLGLAGQLEKTNTGGHRRAWWCPPTGALPSVLRLLVSDTVHGHCKLLPAAHTSSTSTSTISTTDASPRSSGI